MNSFVELASLVAAGKTRSQRYQELCLSTGLLTRFVRSKGSQECIEENPSQAARFALSSGNGEMLNRVLSKSIKAYRRGFMSKESLLTVLECSWHVFSDQAAEVLPHIYPHHPVLPLLAEITGRNLPNLPSRLPIGSSDADVHLVAANLVPEAEFKLCRINKALNSVGQSPIRLINSVGEISVNNLARSQGVEDKSTQALPLVSVIMTCFNNSSHVLASIRSVLQQTWRNLELWVVDDASSDNSWAVVEGLAAEDLRVRPIRMVRNVGTYAAKNAALARAVGEFVAFNDADDWSHPQRLELSIRQLTNSPELVAVTGQYFRLSDAGHITSPRLFPLIRWSPNSIVFRRLPVLESIGYLDENRFGSDSEYVARVRASFGESRHRRLKEVQFVACQRGESLMHGKEFGMDTLGFSRPRREFEEYWAERLLMSLIQRTPLFLPKGKQGAII